MHTVTVDLIASRSFARVPLPPFTRPPPGPLGSADRGLQPLAPQAESCLCEGLELVTRFAGMSAHRRFLFRLAAVLMPHPNGAVSVWLRTTSLFRIARVGSFLAAPYGVFLDVLASTLVPTSSLDVRVLCGPVPPRLLFAGCLVGALDRGGPCLYLGVAGSSPDLVLRTPRRLR